MSKINALIKETAAPEPLPPREDSQVCWLETRQTAAPEHNHAGTLAVDFPASRTVSDEFQISVASKPPVSVLS